MAFASGKSDLTKILFGTNTAPSERFLMIGTTHSSSWGSDKARSLTATNCTIESVKYNNYTKVGSSGYSNITCTFWRFAAVCKDATVGNNVSFTAGGSGVTIICLAPLEDA